MDFDSRAARSLLRTVVGLSAFTCVGFFADMSIMITAYLFIGVTTDLSESAAFVGTSAAPFLFVGASIRALPFLCTAGVQLFVTVIATRFWIDVFVPYRQVVPSEPGWCRWTARFLGFWSISVSIVSIWLACRACVAGSGQSVDDAWFSLASVPGAFVRDAFVVVVMSLALIGLLRLFRRGVAYVAGGLALADSLN